MAAHSSLNSFRAVPPENGDFGLRDSNGHAWECLLWSLISPFQVQPQTFQNSGR
jgi:hypothetical protein